MHLNIFNISVRHLKSLQMVISSHSSYNVLRHTLRCTRTHSPRLFYQPVIFIPQRGICTSFSRPSKEKSKVEETISVLKEKKSTKEKTLKATPESSSSVDSNDIPPKSTSVAPKRSLGKRIIDEIIHYYHGFRLLFIDIRIATRIIWKLLNYHDISRREHKQLVRTTSDIFRLIPFSVFILVPFMELLLPLFIKLFPQMLPSTFETMSDKVGMNLYM